MLMLRLLVLIPMFATVVLGTVSICLLVNTRNKIKDFKETKGKIVKFYENDSELRVGTDAVKAVSPVVVYSVDEQEHQFIGRYCTSSMKVGDTVGVLYDPEQPDRAVMKHGLYFAPLITGILALVFLVGTILLGYVMLFV